MKSDFTVILTEEDRQNAEDFFSTTDCILATALRRVGFPIKSVDGTYVYTDTNKTYLIVNQMFFAEALIRDTEQPPFYTEEIVGREVLLEEVK